MPGPRTERENPRGRVKAPRAIRARGRPRAFDRDAALDVALETFWRKGYRATATRDLEAELGIGQSSLYNAFGSKQALLDAALDRYEALCDRALVGPLARSADGLEAVDRFLCDLSAWLTRSPRRGCMLTNLMVEDAGETPSIGRRAERYRERVREALQTALERAASQGQIGREALGSRARLLLGLVLGMNVAAAGGMPSEAFGELVGAARAEVARWRLA